MNRRLLLILSLCMVGVLVVIGLVFYGEWFGFEGPRTSGAIAPTLEVGAALQTVYRIDPEQSAVRYAVQEIFAGQPVSIAVGTTQQIAGDILLNREDFARSEVGTIVINVEQFESDSGLRDRRIRREYLESSTYPEAVFVPRELVDFPAEIVEGNAYTFTIAGDLTVKATTLPVTWTVTATLNADTLIGSANTTVLMSDYRIGPINIAGFVETADEVQLTFDFVAVAVR
ncbi:MAG: YceI family protein [Anaerolineae bacterium]|nr:YceI family protein [Anaerolineae bacterium]